MDGIAFTVFEVDIKWYGILIASAMALGIIISLKRAKSHDLEQDKIVDLALVCLPVAMIGARIWFVLFNWSSYGGDFMRIINFREGGLAIHGGLIFGIGTAAILCKAWKIPVWNVMDLVAPVIALGQAIGRWGNFFNQEAHGSVTSVPWAIEVNGEMVHPTFLYESVWCFLLFLFLLWVDRRRKFSGQIILLYGMLYSVERFFVEQLRTDSLMVFGMKTAQLVSLAAIVTCGVVYYYRSRRNQTE